MTLGMDRMLHFDRFNWERTWRTKTLGSGFSKEKTSQELCPVSLLIVMNWCSQFLLFHKRSCSQLSEMLTFSEVMSMQLPFVIIINDLINIMIILIIIMIMIMINWSGTTCALQCRCTSTHTGTPLTIAEERRSSRWLHVLYTDDAGIPYKCDRTWISITKDSQSQYSGVTLNAGNDEDMMTLEMMKLKTVNITKLCNQFLSTLEWPSTLAELFLLLRGSSPARYLAPTFS